jgi:threonyl-tRNA synthetase
MDRRFDAIAQFRKYVAAYGSLDLCIGPPIEEGFYYEMAIAGEQRTVLEADKKILEEGAKVAIKKQVYERLEMTKDELRDMFKVSALHIHIARADADPNNTMSENFV